MKYQQYLSKFAFAGAFLIGYTQAFADPVTFDFSLPGPFPGTTGGLDEENTDNGVDLDLTGKVTFDGMNVSLFVENGTDPDSTITKVYLLKPMGINASTLNSHPGDSWSLENSLSQPQGNPGTILTPKPLPSIENDDYFGAVAKSDESNLTAGTSGTFSFTMASTLDDITLSQWEDYVKSDSPHFLVRWQDVGDDGEGSGAGYAYLKITATAVPEPALIAPLGLAGIGCLLVVRRRLRVKAEAAKR